MPAGLPGYRLRPYARLSKNNLLLISIRKTNPRSAQLLDRDHRDDAPVPSAHGFGQILIVSTQSMQGLIVIAASVSCEAVKPNSLGVEMAFPLATVLSAAPGIISAATDIIKVIRDRKKQAPVPEPEKLSELESLIEKQALLIEELAVNNRNMVLAVRNNRIVSAVSMIIAITACVLAVI